MSIARYESIWDLMRRRDFKLTHDFGDEYKCTICKGILINACNAPCGCRFCMDCINSYLGGAHRHCPGELDNCKEDVINVVRDIQIDHAINTRIIKMVVACPEDSCQFQNELRRIDDHLRICHARKRICPYADIGCKEIGTVPIVEHLLADNSVHTKLLIDSIAFLKIEMTTMKSDMDKLKTEVCIQKMIINNLELINNNNINNNINNQYKHKFSESRSQESINLNIARSSSINNVGGLVESRDLVECNNSSSRKRRSVKEIGEVLSIKVQKTEPLEPPLPIQNGNFIWKIDKFKEKKRNALEGINIELYSDPFYSHKNGYKLRLVMCPCGSGAGKGSHLSLFFQIMRGEHDNILSWPMRLRVNVALIGHDNNNNIASIGNNTSNTNTHVSRTYQCDALPDKIKFTFLQPKTDVNTSCGNPKFIDLESLLSNHMLYSNDQIIIKCSVNE